MHVHRLIQWNLSIRTHLKGGHIYKQETFTSPKYHICVLSNPWNKDTSLFRTLYSGPTVSWSERFHCTTPLLGYRGVFIVTNNVKHMWPALGKGAIRRKNSKLRYAYCSKAQRTLHTTKPSSFFANMRMLENLHLRQIVPFPRAGHIYREQNSHGTIF